MTKNHDRNDYQKHKSGSYWTSGIIVMGSQLKFYADRIAEEIRERLLDHIRRRLIEGGVSLSVLARQIGITPGYLSNILSSKQGTQLTLAKALQLWMGLGNPPETLIGDYGIDPLLAKNVYQVLESNNKELFLKILYILSYCEQIKDHDWKKLASQIDQIFQDVSISVSVDIKTLLSPDQSDAKPKRNKKTD